MFSSLTKKLRLPNNIMATVSRPTDVYVASNVGPSSLWEMRKFLRNYSRVIERLTSEVQSHWLRYVNKSVALPEL